MIKDTGTVTLGAKKGRYYQGFFKPRFPQKYKGNPTQIVYRSSYELKAFLQIDKDPSIIEWKSEEQSITYKSPIDGKLHRYFPDLILKRKLKDGSIITQVIEIKPEVQTREPKIRSGKPTKGYINEVVQWGVNSAKWAAAEAYCERKGYEFVIWDEYSLGIKVRK